MGTDDPAKHRFDSTFVCSYTESGIKAVSVTDFAPRDIILNTGRYDTRRLAHTSD